ncbi:filamentous hemagglutinin N-terminal domain-containing protein [Orbus wheelerorum]|uniref:two-partner secretion domain-containing protein n=1 Tax=Orbus wheelerorum TaxID=3074111 RepID=UPI00370DBAFA
MNKHFYRLIFNKARGMVMVVAEIVKRHQGEGRSSQKAKASLSLDKKMTAALKPLSFLTFVALGMVSVVAQSNANTIIADSNANQSQQASIIDRANGPTVVNIQEANQAGVSHNKYTQFDVSKEGVILNNNAQSSNTTLGGNIAGNSNLASSGGAKVILNEINSQNASQLNGRIEVAGQKAQVVIANAAGITCNGCGFINADRATLTTGKLIIGEDGKLNGYQVEQGNITINGAFDSSQQDYTDLIARAVNINDKIQAKNLTVIAGKNKVNVNPEYYDVEENNIGRIEKIDSDDKKTQLSIDVAALGGMYANKIRMVSSETGVGVNNAGHIRTNSDTDGSNISIISSGNITNTGLIETAKGQVVVGSQHQSVSTQSIKSQTNLETNLQTNLQTNLETISNDTNTTQKPTLEGFTEDELINYEFKNSITLKSFGEIVNEGQIKVSVDIHSYYINFASKQDFTNNGNIELSRNDYPESSKLFLLTSDDGNVYNNGNIIAGDTSFYIISKNIYNTSKINAATQDFSAREQFLNTGDIVAEVAATAFAIDFYNKGNIIFGGDDIYGFIARSFNNDGTIISKNNLYIEANELNNTGKLEAKKKLDIDTVALNNYNHGEIISDETLNIGRKPYYYFDEISYDWRYNSIGGANVINNISSTISAGGDLTINADRINNTIKTVDVIAEDIDIKEWSFKSADDKRYNADKITVDYDDIDSDVSHLKIIGTEKDATEYNYYDYNQKTYIVDVLDAQSAQMISGGNMTLSANTIINDHSEINASNTLSTSVGISNYIFDYNTVRKVIKKGTKEYTHDVYDSNGHHFSQTDSSDYNVSFHHWKFKW